MALEPRMPREEERSEDRDAVKGSRAERVPLGTAKSRLNFKPRKGYVRRVINDVEGRLQIAQEGGYQFVSDPTINLGTTDITNENCDLGSRVSRVVNPSSGTKGYLMEIKEEFYKEDQAMKARAIKETEDMMRRGAHADVDGRYVPKNGGLTIEKQ